MNQNTSLSLVHSDLLVTEVMKYSFKSVQGVMFTFVHSLTTDSINQNQLSSDTSDGKTEIKQFITFMINSTLKTLDIHIHTNN